MKLGISMACFRWELYPNRQRTSPDYLAAGNPPLYFSTVPTALPMDQGGLEWLIDYCGQNRLEALYMSTERLQDPVFASKIKDLAKNRHVELIMAANFDWASLGESAKAEREKFVDQMKIAKSMEMKIVNATHGDPRRKNHYTKDPPIATQIEYMTENFSALAKIAEEMNLIIAMENHTDYRCSEIRQVLQAVDSPALRANLDTGNPVAVIEDPIEAAKAVAPYAVKAHLKDYRIYNYTDMYGTPKFFHAPTGMGDIDILQMVDILQREAPDPDNLRLCIETVPPLEVDPGMWVNNCITNVRQKFAKYLT